MFTTPVLQQIKPFDATKDYTFTFTVQSGPQVQFNRLIITNNATNTVVYDVTQQSLVLKHLVPANTLVNGNEYRVKVAVGDGQGNWSNFSEEPIFYTLSPPVITFTNIDELNRVYNQTETFVATYYQAEGEILQSYRFILYNQNKALLTSFPEQFGTGAQPLQQEIAGLINGETYFIEVRTLSQKRQESSSGLVMFIPFYVAPRLLTTLVAEPVSKQGAIKISANILQIIMKLYDPQNNEIPFDIVQYVNNEKLDMNRSDYYKLVAAQGFEIMQPDFVLQIWGENFVKNQPILTLFSDYGELQLTMLEDRLQVRKILYNTDIQSLFVSKPFSPAYSNQPIIINLRSRYNLIDIEYHYQPS